LLAVGGQLVGLVEHHKVVREGSSRSDSLAHPREHALAGKGVQADDEAVAFRSDEGISGAGLRSAHDPERESKQRAHLTLPVADQPSWGHNENALDEAARKNLPKIEPGHDCL